jgi:hypothetical protein
MSALTKRVMDAVPDRKDIPQSPIGRAMVFVKLYGQTMSDVVDVCALLDEAERLLEKRGESCDSCNGNGFEWSQTAPPCSRCSGSGKHPDVSALLAKLREGT